MLDFRTRLLWGGETGGRGQRKGGGEGAGRAAGLGRSSASGPGLEPARGRGPIAGQRTGQAEPHGPLLRPPPGAGAQTGPAPPNAHRAARPNAGRRGDSRGERAKLKAPTGAGGSSRPGFKGMSRPWRKGEKGGERPRARGRRLCPSATCRRPGGSAGSPRPSGEQQQQRPPPPPGPTADPRPRPRPLGLCACPGVRPRGGSAPGRLTRTGLQGGRVVGDWAQRGAGPLPGPGALGSLRRWDWPSSALPRGRARLPSVPGRGAPRCTHTNFFFFFFKEHFSRPASSSYPSPTPSLQPGGGNGAGPPS